MKKTSTTENVKKTLTKFVEAKREQAIINIENSTFFGILLKWGMTHWIFIVITILLSTAVIKYHLENVALRELTLQNEIKALEDQVDSNKQVNESLKKRIKDLDTFKSNNLKELKAYKNKLKNFNEEQLKTELENHIKRLNKRVGL